MNTNDPRLTAKLFSACPPDSAQKAKLEEVLAKKYGRPVELSWQEDKTASGGFRIEIGSEVIDWTAEGRLDQLKERLAALKAGGQSVIPLIRDTVRDWVPEVCAREVGSVLSVADGIAYVGGLENAAYGEILLFEGGIRGMVQELRGHRIGCILFGRVEEVSEGSAVYRTGKTAGIGVSDAMIGRVVDALGAPIDDAGDIRGKAAGGDERDRPFERLGQARIQPLGHGRKAEQETVVQARHRAPSYNGHVRVRRQRNTRKLRRARSQRSERGHDAGADQAAKVGVSGNAVEVRRRAVVHGHHGTDIRQQAACPESPDETVGPHFIGPLIAVFQRNGQIPVREPGRQLKETFAGMGHQRVHAGDDRTDHAPVERHIARPGPGRAESGMTEQIGKLKAKPVAALLGIRRQRIGGHKPLYARYAYLQGRIADVDEQRVHGYLSHVWGAASRFQSATACRTSSALAGSSSFL